MTVCVRDQLSRLARALRCAPHGPEAQTFGPVMDQFFDLTQQPAFLEVGEPTADPHVASFVLHAVRAVTGLPETVALSMLMFRVRESGFVHGSGVGAGVCVAFFWFDALQQGMADVLDLDADRSVLTRVTGGFALGERTPLA